MGYRASMNDEHPHLALIQSFYAAFAERDAQRMAACYAPDVAFSDPVFPELHGDQAGAMWAMLCAAGKDLQIRLERAQADDRAGSATWHADYTFSTGRTVHNVVDAQFTFRDGLIATHADRFDFWRWSRMALGPTGLFLGWTPMLRRKVQQRAAAQLARATEKASR